MSSHFFHQVVRLLYGKKLPTEIEKRAEKLRALHGTKALSEAKQQAIDSGAREDWRVVSLVRKQDGLPPYIDTATRYLDRP